MDQSTEIRASLVPPAILAAAERKPTALAGDAYLSTEHLATNLKSRSIRGGAVTLTAQGIKFLLMVLSQVVLARMLTPSDYGIIAMVSAVLGIVVLFKDSGLSMATVQSSQITHQQVSTLFWLNVALSVGTAIVAVALAPGIAWFYREPRLVPVTIALGGTFILGGLGVQHQALLARQMRFTALATIEIVSMAVGITSAIIGARFGMGYWALVLAEFTRAFVATLLAWSHCPWLPSRPVRHANVGTLLRFGGNLTGFNVVNYAARNCDNILIGWYWGAGPLALYSKAYQLLVLPIQQINGPASSVAVPALSRLHQNPERYRSAYLSVLEKLTVVTMPLTVLMAGTSDWMVRLLLGAQWTGASRIFLFLAISGVIQPVCNSTGWLFITQNRTREMFRWSLISTAIAIASFLLGLPWGAVGVAISYSTIYLLICVPLLFYFVGRSGPIRTIDFYRVIATPAMATIVSAVALFGFRWFGHVSRPVVGIALATTITAVTFLVSLALTRDGRRLLRTSLDLAVKMRTRGSAADANFKPESGAGLVGSAG